MRSSYRISLTYSFLTNSLNWSGSSPSPTKRGGIFSSCWMVTAIPPLPEPSSFVMTRPSSFMALLNSLACWRALLPVVASTTMSLR